MFGHHVQDIVMWSYAFCVIIKEHVLIRRKDVEVIFHARKPVLYNEGEPWVKKGGDFFGVTIGAYDWEKVFELIGVDMLYLIGKKYNS